MNADFVRALIFLTLALAVIAGGPLISLWALNTLFHASIPYTFWTWLATAWLHTVLGTAARSAAKKD